MSESMYVFHVGMIGCVCFAAFDVVCDVFDNGVWDVCLV